MDEITLGLGGMWIAFIVAAIAATPIYRWLLAVKSRQIVSEYVSEHAKKQGTPTMGGLIILVGSFAGFLATPNLPKGLWWIFLGFVATGFLDDFIVPRLIKGKRGLGWKQKILLQLAFAGIAFWQDGWLANPYRGWSWLIVGVLIVLFDSNAYNFADGMDGLAAGLLIPFSLGLTALLFYVIHFPDGNLVSVPAVLVFASVPFLFLNAPPAKVFMGDVGSLPIGATLGYVTAFGLGHAFDSGFHEISNTLPFFAQFAVLHTVLIIELVPVPIQIASVKLFKRRVFPMTPIHHAFEKAGWPETRVVALFLLLQLICVLAAFSLPIQVRS